MGGGVGGEWGLFSKAINPTTFIMNDIKETLEGITSCRSREKYNPHFYRFSRNACLFKFRSRHFSMYLICCVADVNVFALLFLVCCGVFVFCCVVVSFVALLFLSYLGIVTWGLKKRFILR